LPRGRFPESIPFDHRSRLSRDAWIYRASGESNSTCNTAIARSVVLCGSESPRPARDGLLMSTFGELVVAQRSERVKTGDTLTRHAHFFAVRWPT